jgi:negative regulator of flagellin synthesis FlgM
MNHSGEIPFPDSTGEKDSKQHSMAEGQAQGVTEEGDETSVSNAGQTYDLNAIRKIVENTPDRREEKVAALKKMIASGEYKVNAREVADKMIKEFLADGTLKR